MNTAIRVFANARKALVKAGMAESDVGQFLKEGHSNVAASSQDEAKTLVRRFKRLGLKAAVECESSDNGYEFYANVSF
jgi:hypothetical protein